MSVLLSKQGFLGIAAVAWADGRLSKNEAEGLLRAAKACGLDGEDYAQVEQAAAKEVTLERFDASALTDWEKGLTYAIAVFVAKLDGVVNPSESESLKALGRALNLPELKLKAAASAAFDVACLPGGHRPEKYDFAALDQRLREKLPSLRASAPPSR